MATFGHAALGLVAGRLPAAVSRRPRVTQAAFGLLALAPDLDGVIPGLRHDGPTGRSHTPAATVVGTAVVALGAARLGLPWRRSAAAAAVALGSQPVLDALTHGKGEAIFWPVSGRRYFRRVPGLPTWKPEKRARRGGVRSFVGEAAWAVPLAVVAALPVRHGRRALGDERRGEE